MVSYFMFCAFPVCYCLGVITSAINCLERLVSEMTYYVLSGKLNPTHSLTQTVLWLLHTSCVCCCSAFARYPNGV